MCAPPPQPPEDTAAVAVAAVPAVGGAMAAAAVAGFLLPQPFGQLLAASQPGLVLLLLFIGFQQFLQRRYRRRLARMPGFARIHSGSAVAQVDGKGGARDTSTVDSPVNT